MLGDVDQITQAILTASGPRNHFNGSGRMHREAREMQLRHSSSRCPGHSSTFKELLRNTFLSVSEPGEHTRSHAGTNTHTHLQTAGLLDR